MLKTRNSYYNPVSNTTVRSTSQSRSIQTFYFCAETRVRALSRNLVTTCKFIYSPHVPLPSTLWECLGLMPFGTNRSTWEQQQPRWFPCCTHSSVVGIYQCRGLGPDLKGHVETATGWLPPSGTHVVWGTSGPSRGTSPQIVNIKPIPRSRAFGCGTKFKFDLVVNNNKRRPRQQIYHWMCRL